MTEPKLYTLHTEADQELLKEFVCSLAAKSGHAALLEEMPPGSVVGPNRSPWMRRRWFAGLVVNTLVAFAFYWMEHTGNDQSVSGLAGYLIGWLFASSVLLW